MSKRKITRKNNAKKVRKSKKRRGGLSGLPVTQERLETKYLTEINITNQDLESFNRQFKSPMDCVINALQIIRILDKKQANIIRITAGHLGITKEQIELIFMLQTNRNHSFIGMKPNVFENQIQNNLGMNKIVFAGYGLTQPDGTILRHVFLIGRDSNNLIGYIDPSAVTSSEPNIYSIHTNIQEEKSELQKIIESNIDNPNFELYLLYNSEGELNRRDLEILNSYIENMQSNSIKERKEMYDNINVMTNTIQEKNNKINQLLSIIQEKDRRIEEQDKLLQRRQPMEVEELYDDTM